MVIWEEKPTRFGIVGPYSRDKKKENFVNELLLLPPHFSPSTHPHLPSVAAPSPNFGLSSRCIVINCVISLYEMCIGSRFACVLCSNYAYGFAQ